MKKKIVSLFVILCMLASFCAIGASAACENGGSCNSCNSCAEQESFYSILSRLQSLCGKSCNFDCFWQLIGMEQPSEQPAQPSEQPAQPSEQPAQPSEQPAQPSEKPAQPSEEPTQPSEEPAQPSEEPVQPSEEPAQPSEKPTQSEDTSYAGQVLALVNDYRAENGLDPLTLNSSLSQVAQKKAQDMHDSNYFAHESPNYGSPFNMMQSAGISYRTAGENIAMGYSSPAAVVEAWMNSAGHRANILNSSYTQMGLGYVSSGSYWSQMFIG